ncbi:MAG: hypothetical protein RR232_03225 [Clostridia bacterium]
MITIKEVTTKRDLRKFVDYPNVLYKDVPQYVPAMYGDDLDDWDRKKNPAFEYCDAKCFLAYRDGQIVGRIGAIISHKANEKFKQKRMRFSQVDFIDDAEVVDALFGAVEGLAREKGCTQVHGPLGFCDLDREGMLVEGFDRRGMYITYYNHPYYNTHMERIGYAKDTDWVEYLIKLSDQDEALDRLKRVAERAMQHGSYHLAKVKHNYEYRSYVEKVFRLVNIAYADLYGVVELTEKQIKKYSKKFIPLVNPDYACFVMDQNEDMVAFGVGAPSLATALQKSHGRLMPFGWLGVLKALSKPNDTEDMLLVAVHPDLQGLGINAIILCHALESACKNDVLFGETGPQLEYNEKVQAQWKLFDKEQHKRRRCYIKSL